MEIITGNNILFTSLNHPVKPFQIKTKNDIITFKEINSKEKHDNKFINCLASFFLDNFAAQSAHPFWTLCRKNTATFDKITYKNYINTLTEDFNTTFNNPDKTVLIGRNSKNEICAGLITEPLNLGNNIKNDKVMYIDSLAVNKEYRNNHIAKQMLDNVTKSCKGRYKKAFLVAYNESVPFYTKQGFNFTKDKKLIHNVAKQRTDYPEYASFMSKKID